MNYIIQRKKEFRNPRWATIFSCEAKAAHSKIQEFSSCLEQLQDFCKLLLLKKLRKA